jgi:glycosyltransferase involved in cell wall biosynthesis
MDLTVLIPVFNTPAHYLLEAVKCITDQNDGGSHRIILIDDASTQADTRWALSVLGREHEVLRMKWNGGIGAAMNAGHEIVQSEYVAHMDSDDVCAPDRFAAQIAALQQDSYIDVLGCQLFSFLSDDIHRSAIYTSSHPASPVLKKKGRGWIVNHATILIRQEAFIEAGGYATELRRAQDIDLFKRMSSMGCIIRNIPDVMYGWRRNRAALIAELAPALPSSPPSSAALVPLNNEHGNIEIESLPEPASPDTPDFCGSALSP